MLTIEPGRPDDAPVVAELIAETDRDLFTFCSGGDLRIWVEASEWEWREERGVYCYNMSRVARFKGGIVGLLISYSYRRYSEIDWSFGASRSHMPEHRWAKLAAARPLSAYLFPSIPDDAYYVQNIATHQSVRGSGLRVGGRLMELAFERGRAEGCKSCHLDVDSTNSAVGFYEHLGFRVLIKTDVLPIPGVHTHYRMVCDL